MFLNRREVPRINALAVVNITIGGPLGLLQEL